MKLSYRLGWIFFRTLFSTYLPTRYHNAKRLPRQGPVILASNHASFLDPPLVGAGLSRMVNYLARKTLFDVPLLATLLRSWQVVPVDRDGGGGVGLRAIFERLQHGGVILLFPEGTRTRTGQIGPAKSGVGLVIIKSDAPVVPTRVFGTFEAYGRHLRFPRPKRLTVTYGIPLLFRDLRAEAKSCSRARLREIYQQVTDELMAGIARLEPKAD